MNESSIEKDENLEEYSADAIIGYTDDEELHFIFAKVINVEAGLEGRETYLCQINLPIKLLDSLPMLYQYVKAKDGCIHQVFLEKQGLGMAVKDSPSNWMIKDSAICC